jgi:K(+)-stimulated pyrophosphate-energized sodium pump
MVKLALLVLTLVLSWQTLAAAQNPVTADSPFQMRALVSLKAKDAVVVSNSGANGSALCANAYAFDAEDGQLLDDHGNILGKGSFAHAAAVVGDTVGDPLKDTAGPSLHVMVKLLSTITLVLAALFI